MRIARKGETVVRYHSSTRGSELETTLSLAHARACARTLDAVSTRQACRCRLPTLPSLCLCLCTGQQVSKQGGAGRGACEFVVGGCCLLLLCLNADPE